jgi:hypothetical protein
MRISNGSSGRFFGLFVCISLHTRMDARGMCVAVKDLVLSLCTHIITYTHGRTWYVCCSQRTSFSYLYAYHYIHAWPHVVCMLQSRNFTKSFLPSRNKKNRSRNRYNDDFIQKVPKKRKKPQNCVIN